MNYGKIVYEGYCESTGGKSLISGDTLPKWKDLNSEIRKAWEAGAQALYDHIFQPDQITQAARKGFEESVESGRQATPDNS